eukprot:4077888-Prymnesium_polylepis.1
MPDGRRALALLIVMGRYLTRPCVSELTPSAGTTVDLGFKKLHKWRAVGHSKTRVLGNATSPPTR